VVDNDAFKGIAGNLGQDGIRARRARTFGKEKGVAGRFSRGHEGDYDGLQSYEGYHRHRGDIHSGKKSENGGIDSPITKL
jgi:hypothetical protein